MLTLRQRLEQHQAAYVRLKASLVLLEHESRAVLACHRRRRETESVPPNRDTSSAERVTPLVLLPPEASSPSRGIGGHTRAAALETAQQSAPPAEPSSSSLTAPPRVMMKVLSPGSSLACRLLQAKGCLDKSKQEQQGVMMREGGPSPKDRLRERARAVLQAQAALSGSRQQQHPPQDGEQGQTRQSPSPHRQAWHSSSSSGKKRPRGGSSQPTPPCRSPAPSSDEPPCPRSEDRSPPSTTRLHLGPTSPARPTTCPRTAPTFRATPASPPAPPACLMAQPRAPSDEEEESSGRRCPRTQTVGWDDGMADEAGARATTTMVVEVVAVERWRRPLWDEDEEEDEEERLVLAVGGQCASDRVGAEQLEMAEGWGGGAKVSAVSGLRVRWVREAGREEEEVGVTLSLVRRQGHCQEQEVVASTLHWLPVGSVPRGEVVVTLGDADGHEHARALLLYCSSTDR